MKKILLLLSILLFISQKGNSQSLLAPIIINDGNSLADEFSIVLKGINIPAGGQITYRDSIIHIGDTLHHCNLTDQFYVKLNDNIIMYNYPFATGGAFQITSYTPPSSHVAYDGSISVRFDVVQPYAVWAVDIFNAEYPFTTTDNQNYTFTNFSEGILNIHGRDALPTYTNNQANVFIGNPENIFTNGLLNIEYNQSDANYTCSGSIDIFPTNAVGNVSYQWSNDSILTTSSQVDLCPGGYSIYAVDSIGQQALLHITITDDPYTYNDTTIGYLIGSDSIYFEFLNCDIDYNTVLDSIIYNETLVSQMSDYPLIFDFTITMYQGGNTFFVSDSIAVYDDSVLYISSAIFCQEMKSIFTGLRFNFVHSGPHTSVSTAFTDENKNLAKNSVFPNPTSDILKIEGEFYTGHINTINGQLVMNFSSKNISLQHLENGLYFLYLDNSAEAIKILKN